MDEKNKPSLFLFKKLKKSFSVCSSRSLFVGSKVLMASLSALLKGFLGAADQNILDHMEQGNFYVQDYKLILPMIVK